jgi:SOS-response transcriptional repressor LexA
LRGLATGIRTGPPNLEELERTLTVLEEKLFATLLATTSEADLTAVREQAARELAPYKRRMQAMQIRQIEQQFLHKRLLEKYRLPRMSLFYMSQS